MHNTSPKPKKDSFFSLHFTSTITISLVLFLIGLIALITLSAHEFTTQTKENLSVSVILKNTIEDNDLTRLKNYIAAAPFTKESKYISKEDALAEYTAAMGGDPSEFLGYNPLYASIEVFLQAKYADNDSIAKLVEPKIKSFPGVKSVDYHKDMLSMFNQNIQKLTLLLSAITIILLFISIVLINNTIRLSIYSKRFLIKTMQLVGAKPSFIRRPFILRSLTSGFIASGIAMLFIIASVYYVRTEIGATFDIYKPEIIVPVIAIILIFSILITYIATFISVNKYLRMKTDKLYYI